tara:strand:- start:327 stop:1904 length:1578 start_codon:yes stop_codon:yes gene_type:complete
MKTYQDHIRSTQNLKRNNVSRKPVLRSSAIFPFLLNNSLDTNILFLGYWLIKRNIKEVTILITIRSESGSILKREIKTIDRVQAYKISLKKMLNKKIFKNLFMGSIELEVFSLQDMVYPYPAFVINFETKDASSMVHTCGRIYNDLEDYKSNSKIKIPESGFDIIPEREFMPFFSFVNGAYPIKSQNIKLQLLNFEGEKLNKKIHLKKVLPYETKFIFFLNSNEKKFFKGKKGTVIINHDLKGFFPRFLSGNINKSKSKTSLTHTYYDTSKLKNKFSFWKNPNTKQFYDSSVSFPLFYKNNSYTEFAIYPNFPKSNLSFDLEIYDADGKLNGIVKSFYKLTKRIDYPLYFNFKNILEENNKKLNNNKNYFAKVIVNGEGITPARLKFGLNIGCPKKYNVSSNVCFNAHVPNASTLKKVGTFKWAPIINKTNSILTLSNTSFLKKNNKKANITLKFWNEINDKFIKRTISINDNGSFWFYLNKDSEVTKFLNNKTGWVTIQSDNPFVNGWYLEVSNSGIVGADHLF